MGRAADPVLGGRGVFMAALLALVLGARGVRRGITDTARGRYAARVAVAVTVLTPLTFSGLFLLVHIYAAILAVPYAALLVGCWTGLRRYPRES